MTEESDSTRPVPGSTAGDSAPTQAIPRIPRTAAQTERAQTDKGRPRESAPPPPPASGERRIEPSGGPTGRPLTATDYARTTRPSAATTSVIPAVKEKVADRSADQTRTDQKRADPAKTDPAKTDQKRTGLPGSTASPATTGGSGRRASLRLTHVEPWSVTRLAFAISVALMIVSVVAVAIFWVVLNLAGVWDQINDSLTSVLSDETSSFNVTDYFGFTRMVGLTLVLSAANVVLMTLLATIGAHLYNVAAQLMGGVEVTFTEDR